jgi:hypothetical protein
LIYVVFIKPKIRLVWIFPLYSSVLDCLCLASSKPLGLYRTQSKALLVDIGDLRLCGWQNIDAFLIFRVVRVDDLCEVLLITHSWLPELLLLW